MVSVNNISTYTREEEFLIRLRIRQYYDIQKLRIASEARLRNRFIVCEKNHWTPVSQRIPDKCPKCGSKVQLVELMIPESFKRIYEELVGWEKAFYNELYALVKNHPLWTDYLSMIKGIGPVLAAWLITDLNPARFTKPSSMWRFCGLHVIDGKAPRRATGQPTDFNPFARTMAWKLGESFRKVGGVYRYFYEKSFEESLVKHPDWSRLHHINHARRVTVKLFLSHYYEVGRRILGLPTLKPYPAEKWPGKYIPPLIDYPPGKKTRFYELVIEKMDPWTREKYETLVKEIEKWLEKKKNKSPQQGK